MTLQLSESQGVLSVNGALNSRNVQLLNCHVSKSFQPAQSIRINLERVTEFDATAAFELLKMFIESVATNSKFSIVALQNEKVLKVFRETETLAIWNNSKRLT